MKTIKGLQNKGVELNNIYNCDCLEGLKLLGDDSIDLIITSPPYNMRECVGGFFKQNTVKHIWKNSKLRKGYDKYSDNMPYEEYVEWQRHIIQECLRVLKPNGAMFYNHKFRIQNHKLIDRKEIVQDFPVRQIIIWDRNCSVNFNFSHIPPSYEVFFLITNPDFRFNARGGWRDVWQFPPERQNKHPAPFPLAIPKLILSKTKAQIILDPFMGSGTVALACQQMQKDYIGFEISKEYCEMAEKRIKNSSTNTNK